MGSSPTPAREYSPGMGIAVADRTINRKIKRPVSCDTIVTFEIDRDDTTSLDSQIAKFAKNAGWGFDGEYHVDHGDDVKVTGWFIPPHKVETEKWEDVAYRVSHGNALLEPRQGHFEFEFNKMHHHLRQASLLMSGRHLQHGDDTQPTRPGEVFVNCLDGETRILTMEYGPIEIGKIANQIVTVIAGDGVPRGAQINEHGEQDVFDIVFSQNSRNTGVPHVVRATANHRWKLADGSITDALKVGDIIAPPKAISDYDPQAVIHGLIYGDGSAHKSRNDHVKPGVSQGRTYATIRVCKKGDVVDEIHRLLDGAGYSFTTPPSCDGDRLYYIGKFPHAKDLPFTNDPEYIAGFIHGWWLADGHKGINHALEISTSNEQSVEWLKDHAAYAGYTVTMHRVMERKPGDGSFANGKALHVLRIRQNLSMKVLSITPVGKVKVYCPEEPITSTFVLANGLLTGNCATSATTFLLFYLLLNGSGVGRAYDDALIKADLSQMSIVVPVIDWSHRDVQAGIINGYSRRRDAEHMYSGRKITVFDVPDSREGWAKAVEIIERMAFEGRRDEVLILDFTGVRPKNEPIMGMQGRPASGPGPLMGAIASIAKLRDAGMAPWRAAMYADHFAAECVLVGGARRAARMGTKNWRDETIFDFIELKRGGFLWSSNNSVCVDEEFWAAIRKVHPLLMKFPDVEISTRLHVLEVTGQVTKLEAHAYRVLRKLAYAAYHDKTGEPGLINQHKLTAKNDGIDQYLDGLFAESSRFKVDDDTVPLMKSLAEAALGLGFIMICNPCGEIAILLLGGYCTIADVVPFFAANDDDAEDAFRTATRALMRTNLLDFIYGREVRRTNRIGVGITGFHEWAYSRFGYAWHDIIDEAKSRDMWLTLARFKRAVVDEAEQYAAEIGVEVPHTNTTFKPAGTTSKLFGLTEGAHLPTMREFLRWVQFRHDDPLVAQYEAMGYQVKNLKSYEGTTIVGFPTKPMICELDGGEWVVTASEATPAEQYQFVRLLEKYWITGVEEDGVTPLPESGNQVSYTLKYDPEKVSYEEFLDTLIEGQSTIRCCSVMPATDTSAYEYLPEQPVDKLTFERIAAAISNDNVKEDVGLEHVDCSSGACPVSWGENETAA